MLLNLVRLDESLKSVMRWDSIDEMTMDTYNTIVSGDFLRFRDPPVNH